MLWFDPAYGFWMFLICCFLLVWLSFATKTDGPGTWVRQLGGAARFKWKYLVDFYISKRQKSESRESGSERRH